MTERHMIPLVFFDTDRSFVETLEGMSVGYKHDFSFGDAEFNALVGTVMRRDLKFYDSASDDHKKATVDSDLVYQVEGLLGTKYGKFRAAYLEAKDTTIETFGASETIKNSDSFSLGYSFDSGSLFAGC